LEPLLRGIPYELILWKWNETEGWLSAERQKKQEMRDQRESEKEQSRPKKKPPEFWSLDGH